MTLEKDSRLLPYDLQILYDHVNSHGIPRVALFFEDSEAFHGKLLIELIELLRLVHQEPTIHRFDICSCWKDRIRFVLLFGIATSVDLFQAKLSRNAIRCLESQQLEVDQANMEEVFKAICHGSAKLFFGPGLSKILLERQKESVQSPPVLLQALKVIAVSFKHRKSPH